MLQKFSSESKSFKIDKIRILFQQKWQKAIIYADCQQLDKVCPGSPQASKTESFVTTVNSFPPLTDVAKLSIIDICEGPGYAPG